MIVISKNHILSLLLFLIPVLSVINVVDYVVTFKNIMQFTHIHKIVLKKCIFIL